MKDHRRLVVGVGGRHHAEPAELLELVAKVLADHGRSLTEVDLVSTIDRRADSAGVRRLVAATGAHLRSWPAEQLAGQPVQAPSRTVDRHVGTPSVAEAALRAAGATPAGPAHKTAGWVVVIGVEGRDERPDLLHHGDAEVEPGMLDFAVNVHEASPPVFLREALSAGMDDLARYPDVRPATQAVADAHGVPTECVLLTSGAAEAFTLVAQQPWRSPVVVHPQFTEPEAALVAAGHRVDRLLLAEADAFRLTTVPQTDPDLVVIGNPTNPTSRLHTPDELGGLVRDDRLVAVDEAFMDAVEDPRTSRHSMVTRAASDPRVLVIRSLTKTYSIAGLRIGYVVGHPSLLARLSRRRPPWPVSSLAAAAAVACLSDEGRAYAAEVRADLPGRLSHLGDGLRSQGFAVTPEPRGPFLLARHPRAAELRNRLRTQGIAVRRGDSFPGLGDEWLRFAAREQRATDVLLDALALLT